MSDTAEYWDGQAARFDDEPDHGLRAPEVRAAWRSLLLASLPEPGARIADIGCGTGTLSVLLAQAGFRVAGIDLAPGMVQRARAKAREARVRVDFGVSDAMRPPWPAGSFDVVLVRHVLWALPDPGAGLGRWLELLAPGGRLVLIEGRWSTGAGITAADAEALLRAYGRDAHITSLDNPLFWGGEITDERYLLVSVGKLPGDAVVKGS